MRSMCGWYGPGTDLVVAEDEVREDLGDLGGDLGRDYDVGHGGRTASWELFMDAVCKMRTKNSCLRLNLLDTCLFVGAYQISLCRPALLSPSSLRPLFPFEYAHRLRIPYSRTRLPPVPTNSYKTHPDPGLYFCLPTLLKFVVDGPFRRESSWYGPC